MGTANIYFKAVKLFNIKNSELTYDNIGTIKDVDIVSGPLEDLPKYLNHAGPYSRQLIKKRLEGYNFGTYFRPKITMTHDELKDALYKEYLAFKKRKKEKHYICALDRSFTGDSDKLFHRPRGRRYSVTCDGLRGAMIFDSWEEAALMCSRYNIGDLSPLGNYITSQGNYTIQKLADYEESTRSIPWDTILA